MATPIDKAEAAALPAAGLAWLAGLRGRGDVLAVVAGARAWVTWPRGDVAAPRALLAAPGIEFFERRGPRWHALGASLPRFDVPPPGEARPLDAILFPEPLTPADAPTGPVAPARLRLAPCIRPRPATALRAALADLAPWIDAAPSAEIAACRGAVGGDLILVRGPRLPPLPRGERFWGGRVLVPLGRRPEPDLPETALRAAAGVALDELLLLTDAGLEAVPESALVPLSRAGLRLAVAR